MSEFVNVLNELPTEKGFYTVQLRSGEIDEALFSNGKFYCDSSSKTVFLLKRGSLKNVY